MSPSSPSVSAEVLALSLIANGVLLLALLRARRQRVAVDALVCEACDQADDVDHWVRLCHEHRRRRKNLPLQSSFRVAALVTYRLDGASELRHVTGHNDEACNLRNSCCAERAAFLELAGRAGGATTVEVVAVYITSDAPHALTPGALCREYMYSSPWTTPSMPIHMEGEDGPPSRQSGTLAQLWPLASPYTQLDRAGQVSSGRALQGKIAGALHADLVTEEALVYRAAAAACTADGRTDVHPVSYGAAVLFADGNVAAASQVKATEYGCSLDALCQLAPAVASAQSRPKLFCMVDHFGVLHAPFSAARAYLIEHGHGEATVLVHDELGTLHRPRACELMPSTPHHTFC